MKLSELLRLPDATTFENYTLTDGTMLDQYFQSLGEPFTESGNTVRTLKDYLSSTVERTGPGIELDQDIFDGQGTGQGDDTTASTVSPEQIHAIATPDRTEKITRTLIGGLYSFVLAFTVLSFTSLIVIVSIERKEFPSAWLAGIVIIPTMAVSWQYMGIINRERRDILSAVVGDKINSSVIGDVINTIRRR